MNPRLSIWYATDYLEELDNKVSTYAYCHANPVNLIDDDGMKDKAFMLGKDKPITIKEGTSTIFFQNGRIIDNEMAKIAYNCHSYAWENSQGDPSDPKNRWLVKHGVLKWDEDPSNNMVGYTQLDFNSPNIIGDRVIYYYDSNQNGRYDKDENIVHSAIVDAVDKEGNTTIVRAKMGQEGISYNHPRAKNYYEGTSRAYFRKQLNHVSVNMEKIIAPRDATYVAPKHPIVILNDSE